MFQVSVHKLYRSIEAERIDGDYFVHLGTLGIDEDKLSKLLALIVEITPDGQAFLNIDRLKVIE